MKEKKLHYWRRRGMENLPLLQVLMSPKISTIDYLDHRSKKSRHFPSIPMHSPNFTGGFEGKNLGRIFFGEDELDYATLLQDWQINCILLASALQAIRTIREVYLEEKPSGPTASTSFVCAS